MPTYVYRTERGKGEEEYFEVVQPMSEDALTEHPETGEPVVRVPQMPMIGGRHSEASEKRSISDSNLDRLGFTKYVNTGNGYEKTAGAGPSKIKKEMYEE